MTLGERIQSLRKAAGLSQEELGDTLGVARQSVSKWESDATVPELDKLIAMSRLFEVSIGALLGLEEPAEPRREFSEKELSAMVAMVEKLALADLQEKLPARESAAPSKKRWPWVVGGIVAAIAVFVTVNSFKIRMDNLQGQVNGLGYSIANTQTSVSNQINSLTGQLTEILEQQNSVTAEKSYTIKDIDPQGETVTFSLSATPRQYQEGMTAQFIAEGPDFETVTVPGILEGQRFTADLVCPLADDITLSMAFRVGETTQNQGLETVTGLLERSRPQVYLVDSDLWLTPVDQRAGTYDSGLKTLYVDWYEGYLPGADGATPVQVRDVTLRVWVDDALAMTIPVDEPDPEGRHPLRVQTEYHLSGLELGTRVTVSAKFTDSLGREEEQWLEGYEVGREDGWKGWRLLHTPDSDERPWERT